MTKKPVIQPVFVGIDGSFRQNGLAVAVIAPNFVNTYLFKDLRSFQKWFDFQPHHLPPPEEGIIAFEDNKGSKEVVHPGKYKAWLKANGMTHSQGLRDKYAMSVGKNIAATNYVADMFRERYKPRRVIGIPPPGKINLMMLKAAYGIKLSPAVSQDEIDATVIACMARERHKSELNAIKRKSPIKG